MNTPYESSLESSLRRLPLRTPSAALDRRMVDLLSEGSPSTTPPAAVADPPAAPRLGRGWMPALAALAATLALTAAAGLAARFETGPAPSALPALVASTPTASTVRHDAPSTLAAAADDADAEPSEQTVMVRFVDDGLFVTADRQPLRRYQTLKLQQVWTQDPATGLTNARTVPVRQVLYVPQNIY